MTQDVFSPHGTQYQHTVIPLSLAFVITFVSLFQRNPRPRSTFAVITGLIFWACRHIRNFPFDQHLNDDMTAVMLMFLAYQFVLHCAIPSAVLQMQRDKSAPSWVAVRENAQETETQARPVDQTISSLRNWRFAYKMLWNPRFIGTPWQAPIPKSSKSLQQNNNQTNPTSTGDVRWRFLRRRAVVLFWRFVVLCVHWDPLFYRYMPDKIPWTFSDFCHENRFLLALIYKRRPMARAAAIRLHLLLDEVIGNDVQISAQHDVLAIAAVAAGLDDPEDWPPLFGHVSQAYTVRRYWNQYWHLLVHRSFSAISEVLLGQLLGLGKYAAAMRYLKFSMVFVISGLMHLAVEWIVHSDACSQCGCSWSFWNFTLQIVAIVLEEVFQKLLIPRWIWRSRSWSIRLLVVSIGYLWVLSWKIWLLEMNEFPRLYCAYTIVD